MVDFKKRALILTLAATVSVTGSFAADNYKNCLMNMEFKAVSSNQINLVLNTKTPYGGTISPMRKDAETFIIMLPEIDNQAPTPDLSAAGNCIKSVEIRKMPYANGAKGYTKILIKTLGTINLNATSAVYVPPPPSEKKQLTADSNVEDILREINETPPVNEKINKVQNQPKPKRDTVNSQPVQKRVPEKNPPKVKEKQKEEVETVTPKKTDRKAEKLSKQEPVNNSALDISDDSNQKYLIGLLVIFVLIASAIFYVNGQGKMTKVLGENLKIDLSDEEPEDKNKARRRMKKISSTINKLDATYQTSMPFKVSEYTKETDKPSDEHVEEANVVDLDTLFKEKQENDKTQTEQALSDALDDFLSGFTFDDSELAESIKNAEENSQIDYDEDFYERLLKATGISFTKDDIICFQNLLQSEIGDEVLRNIEEYVAPSPVENKGPSKDKLLEKFVTDYAISQNVTFNEENIRTLKKLMSVELDREFIYDLRTDAKRTKSMEEEIQNVKPVQKKEESVILKVKDLLPNLSEALQKQGNRPIETEAKPQVVYYKEGYEVSKLSLDVDLPDLAKEVKHNRGYVSKPSADYETVDNSYNDSVQKLSITGLPDLKDVAANPEKYADKPPEEYVPDEDALLKSIMNVEFKPFDDGTRKFEIINQSEDEIQDETTLAVDDIKKEFSQFSNFELAEAEENDRPYTESDFDDFEALYSQQYVDLDAQKTEDVEENKIESVDDSSTSTHKDKKSVEPDNFVLQDLNRTYKAPARKNQNEKSDKMADILAQMMDNNEETSNDTQQDTAKSSKISDSDKKQKNTSSNSELKCIFEGINYDIISSAVLKDDIGCHLAKSNNGYAIFGYNGDTIKILKEFKSLKSEKIFARLSETLSDGTSRYLIKVGLNKLVVDIKGDDVKYVMDLC